MYMHPCTYLHTCTIANTCRRMYTYRPMCVYVYMYTCIYICMHIYAEGARWSSGINAANGAGGPRFASRTLPAVQRPWTSR